MIVLKLQGRLGNQLFVYAFGLKLESLLGQSVVYDCLSSGDGLSSPWRRFLSWVRRHVRCTGYSVELTCMGLTVRKATILDLAMRRLIVLNEKNFKGFEDLTRLAQQGKNLYIDGYWQTNLFFSGIEQQIRQKFAFHRDLPEQVIQIRTQIWNCSAVAVHVRRGDYVLNPRTAAAHNICGIAYYKKAIKVLEEKVPDATFFVFSDDISWCKDHLVTNGLVTYFIDTAIFHLPHLDFELMINCKHFIIANSSYSWWAAYLGGSEDKVVVAPQLWNRFHPESHPQCEEWILLTC